MNILINPIDSFIQKTSSGSYEIIPFSINFFQKIKENTCFSLYFLIDDEEKDILECIIKEFLYDGLLTYTIISHSQLQFSKYTKYTNSHNENKEENWILIGNHNFHNDLLTYYNNTFESSILNSILNSIQKSQSLNILITNLNPSSQSSSPIKSISPDYIFETIEQCSKLVSHIISSFNNSNNSNSSLNNVKSLSINYFKDSIRILYMLETRRIKKNYRKREVTISSDLILYIPILYYISMSNSVENLRSIVSSLGIKAFLQRSPEFYFGNKEFSFQIQDMLIELGVKLIDPFEKLDFLYNRINQLCYLHELKAKVYKSNSESEFEFYIPNSYFDSSWVDDNSNSNSNSKPIRQVSLSLNYPIIVKREYSGNHNMNIIINKSDYINFSEDINKNNKNHNQNLVFQELIPHGRVIGKIYYLNNKTKLVLRNSICVNSYNEEFITESLYKQKVIVYDDHNVFHERLQNSYKNMTFLCEFIRKNEGISLFNIDFIIHESSLDLYILEINYFPSYNEYGQDLQKEFDEYLLSLSIK